MQARFVQPMEGGHQMPFDRDEQTEGPARDPEVWISFVGIICCFGGVAVVILSHYDLVKLGATCLLVGFLLYFLPKYLHSWLWPFVALPLALGILGIVLAPSEVGAMCILAAAMLFIFLWGLWVWRVK